jgi:chaperonin GroES
MMTEAGKTIPMNVKVGDNVMLPEYGGMEVKFGDSASEMFLYREHDILGKFS